MTKRHIRRVRLRHSIDPVGYGHPPREHQFKPGQSGNPRGRPKGAKNESTILHELLNRKVTLTEGGKSRKVTILEAMFVRFAEDSLKGNTKSAAFLLNRYGTMVSGEIQRDSLNEEEREVLESYAQRLLAEFKSDGRKR
jgi:hypothetical protein